MKLSFNQIIITPIALGVAAMLLVFFTVDLRIPQFIQQFDNPIFHWLMVAVSWLGYRNNQFAIAFLAALLLLRLRLRIEAVFLLISLISGLLLASVIKLIIARPRPASTLAEVYRQHTTFSFPSGHVVSYMAFYGFLFYLVYTRMAASMLRTVLLVVLGALMGLVGLSRVYLGAHWASDTLAGYCIGFLWLTLMIQIYHRLKTNRLAETSY
jgi:membrane-associated phospholipid phosphatase